MMMTIRLYSHMGKKFGRVHRANLETGSVAEAVRYLRANYGAMVDKYLCGASKRGFGFAVFRGKENLSKDQLREPCHGDDIRIAPVILGSKNAGVFQVILGAALVVIGGVITGWSFGAASPFGTAIAMAGAGMIVGGIVQMLTPRPKSLAAGDSPENTPSYAFNGPINTQAQGHCVPVLYGKLWVGSAVISGGTTVKDDVRAPLSGVTPPGGGIGGILGYMGRLSNGPTAVTTT